VKGECPKSPCFCDGSCRERAPNPFTQAVQLGDFVKEAAVSKVLRGDANPCFELNHDFGWALEQAKRGRHITRRGWNGKGMWVAVQTPTSESKMSRPYLYISTVDRTLGPWVASHADLLTDDWAVDPNGPPAKEAP
jgi:hypothetical protein